VAKVLMATWDGGGNVPPVVMLGRRLAERGHEVRVLGHAQQRARVEAAGLAFAAYVEARPFSRVAARPDDLEVFRTFEDAGAGRDLDAVLDEWPADAAVCDCLMLGPLQAAIRRGVPTAAVVHSIWAYFGEMFPLGPVTEMAAPAGRAPRELWAAADEVLVAADRELDPVAGEVPENVRWTGVVLPPAIAPARPGGSRVLLSLSTVWFEGQQESVQRILDAVEALPVEVVATFDESVAVGGLRIPANVDARPFVDHVEVMPTVSAVIGHGGFATTMLALAHGLPLAVVPQHPMLDQPVLGHLVAREGAGLVFDQHPPVDALRDGVRRLLEDGAFAARAGAIGERLRAQDGATAAAERVEALAQAAVAT
jgi:UDP:flavonoid glycosyltransferase YjiC (YdhE family)